MPYGAALAGLVLLVTQSTSVGRPHHCDAYYSPQMQQDGLYGSVMVAFLVTEQGATKDIRLAATSGHDLLDRLAKACVSHWKYKPALRGTVPIETEWRARIDFGKPGEPSDRLEIVLVPGQSAAPQQP
jgi:TonB family protein